MGGMSYTKQKNYLMDDFVVEHIDPLWKGKKYQLVCGFDCEENTIIASRSYNNGKGNAFVPYRVKSYPAPLTFGDICEFWIDGEWCICAFGGNNWRRESNKIGNNSSEGGKINAEKFFTREHQYVANLSAHVKKRENWKREEYTQIQEFVRTQPNLSSYRIAKKLGLKWTRVESMLKWVEAGWEFDELVDKDKYIARRRTIG